MCLPPVCCKAASPGAAPRRCGRTAPTRVDDRPEAARATEFVFTVDPVRWVVRPNMLNADVYVSDVARRLYRTATVENEAAPERPRPVSGP